MLDDDPSGSVILDQRGLESRQGGQSEASEQSWQETMRFEGGSGSGDDTGPSKRVGMRK